MAVYDCFTFHNELELLEIRLNEIDADVDHFVIVEAPMTFQGREKPLFFHENKERFSRFADKIIHVVVDDMPATDNPWDREHFQRNAIRRGLNFANPADCILISDVDEIPKPAAIRELKQRANFTYLEMRLFVYALNLEVTGGEDIPWIKVYGGPWSEISRIENFTMPREGTPAAYLERNQLGSLADNCIFSAGWHFSWQGSAQKLIDKLGSFSHTENKLQQWRDPKRLEKAFLQRKFFTSGASLADRNISELPDYVQRNASELTAKGMIKTFQPLSRWQRISFAVEDFFRR